MMIFRQSEKLKDIANTVRYLTEEEGKLALELETGNIGRYGFVGCDSSNFYPLRLAFFASEYSQRFLDSIGFSRDGIVERIEKYNSWLIRRFDELGKDIYYGTDSPNNEITLLDTVRFPVFTSGEFDFRKGWVRLNPKTGERKKFRVGGEK